MLHPLCPQLAGLKWRCGGAGKRLLELRTRPGTAQGGHCSAAAQLGGRKLLPSSPVPMGRSPLPRGAQTGSNGHTPVAQPREME